MIGNNRAAASDTLAVGPRAAPVYKRVTRIPTTLGQGREADTQIPLFTYPMFEHTQLDVVGKNESRSRWMLHFNGDWKS